MLQDTIRSLPAAVMGLRARTILRSIEGSQGLVIPACDGKNFLANAREVFKSFIASDLMGYKFARAGNATKEVAVEIYGQVEDATFAQIFGFISHDLNKLCFTQHQIEVFCTLHPEFLHMDGACTFFLFKELGHYSIAQVRVRTNGRSVSVNSLELKDIWLAKYVHRVVVPKQIV